jgi:hypothetical protein
MSLPQIAIPGFDGLSHTVNTPNSGRQNAADSAAAVLSNEDKAVLDSILTKLNASLAVTAASLPLPTGSATSANQTALNALFPTSLGTKTAANSFPVTLSSDGTFATAIGAASDATVANGASGSALAYLRTIKDGITSNADSPVEVHQPCDVINYVPVLDTAAYAAGDVLAATAVISNVMRVNDGRANVISLTGIDKSKQKPAMTILFYQTNVTSAAANAANNLSDADQLTLLGFQRILATDWIDYANNSICGFKGPTSPGILLEAATGTKDVYAVCILDAGTPTFAVGDLMFKLGVAQS